MPILIDLPPDVLDKYSSKAKQNGRSRKKEIEVTLIESVQGRIVVKELKKQPQAKTKVVKVIDLNKQALGEKIYSPMDNPLFRAKNRIK